MVTMEEYVDDILKSYEVKGTAATLASSNRFELCESKQLNAETSTVFQSRTMNLLYS